MEMAALISRVLTISVLSDIDANSLLGAIAIALLAFVTISVAYITYIDWKDRRRKINQKDKI